MKKTLLRSLFPSKMTEPDPAEQCLDDALQQLAEAVKSNEAASEVVRRRTSSGNFKLVIAKPLEAE